jgi:hypothetical protein
MEPSQEDPIGYRKPPKKTQFKPGQSGNPKGRPKGARNLHNILEEELGQKVSVTENGKRKRVGKDRLMVRQQVNKAAQGDPKAFQAIARIQQAAEAALKPGLGLVVAPQSELTDEQCFKILERWFRAPDGSQP